MYIKKKVYIITQLNKSFHCFSSVLLAPFKSRYWSKTITSIVFWQRFVPDNIFKRAMFAINCVMYIFITTVVCNVF